MTSAVRRRSNLPARTPPICEQQLGFAVVGTSPHLGVHLISVTQPVDQASLLRLSCSTRPGVDQLPYPITVHATGIGDGLYPVAEDRLDKSLQRLPVSWGVFGTQHHVGRILVFAALFHLRLDTKPVERAA